MNDFWNIIKLEASRDISRGMHIAIDRSDRTPLWDSSRHKCNYCRGWVIIALWISIYILYVSFGSGLAGFGGEWLIITLPAWGGIFYWIITLVFRAIIVRRLAKRLIGAEQWRELPECKNADKLNAIRSALARCYGVPAEIINLDDSCHSLAKLTIGMGPLLSEFIDELSESPQFEQADCIRLRHQLESARAKTVRDIVLCLC